MSQPLKPFNIMAKPVCGRCNLDCSYCYYTYKTDELYPEAETPLMSDETLESYTRQYCQAQPPQVTFGWQGGEPTLAGLDFFRKAVELQKQYRLEGQTVENALQTNGTLLDDEWCDFLAEHQFLVGLSIDGPPQWHDHYRRDHGGKASFHRAWAALERMRERGVEFNILVTLNSVNAPHAGDIYRYFVNRGVQYVQFIPILERDEDGRPTDYSCTPEQFGQFMLEVFELWATRDVGRVSERFIDSVVHTLIYGAAAQCCQSEECGNAHVLEWNGDLYACDHFVYPQWKLGNILETPMVDLLRGEKLQEFNRLKTDLPAACVDCEYLPLCRGGCPKHHMPLYGDDQRTNYFCEGYKAFFREALPELERMARDFKLGRMPEMKKPKDVPAGKSATTPAAQQQAASFEAGPAPDAPQPMKARMQQQAAITAAGGAPNKKPNRNDPCPCGSGRKFKQCCGRK